MRVQASLRWAAVALVTAGSLTVPASAQGAVSGPRTDPAARFGHIGLGRQILPANDGWASAEGGVTGGSAAAADHVFVVHNRTELAAAVAGDQPKIVYVTGRFDANVDPHNRPLTCADYAADGWDLNAYLAAYDPKVYHGAPTGPLEDARKASNTNQGASVVINVGSNTTIVGMPNNLITGAQLTIESVHNVIVRNLTLSDAYSCFPGWNGDAWKTEWDNIEVSRSTHVWIDHVALDDGKHPDAGEPLYFGQHYMRHDGLLDIVRGSDLVTVSWCRLSGHDKTMLWGNSDTATTDAGKIRITLHHSALSNLIQRGPRVRFGQVHVYNNLYTVPADSGYLYSWGVGTQSAIYAQNNAFRLAPMYSPASIIGNYGGTAIHEDGTWVNGRPVDVLAAYNAAHDVDLSPDVGWSPVRHTAITPTWLVPWLVQNGAGARLGAGPAR